MEEAFDLLIKFVRYAPTTQARILHIVSLVTVDKSLVGFLLKSNGVLTKSINYGFLTSWLGSGLIISTGKYFFC